MSKRLDVAAATIHRRSCEFTVVWDGTRATDSYLCVDVDAPRPHQPAPVLHGSIRLMTPREQAALVAAATAPGASVSAVADSFNVTYAALKSFVGRRLKGWS